MMKIMNKNILIAQNILSYQIIVEKRSKMKNLTKVVHTQIFLKVIINFLFNCILYKCYRKQSVKYLKTKK